MLPRTRKYSILQTLVFGQGFCPVGDELSYLLRLELTIALSLIRTSDII